MSTPTSHTPSYNEDKDAYGDLNVLPVEALDNVTALDENTTHLRQQFTYEDGERLKRRVDRRLLTFLALAYLMKNIDANVISVSSSFKTRLRY